MDYMFVLLLLFIGIVDVNSKTHYTTHPNTISRATVYNPRIINKVCMLSIDAGPCRANIKMFFFNATRKNCSTFDWGGCQGNGNRFNTLDECLSTCLSKPNPERSRPKYCLLNYDYGYCFGSQVKYYFDPRYTICKETIFSGCGGNRNNFDTLGECEDHCRKGKLKTLPTTLSDNLQKFIIINAPQGSNLKGTCRVKTCIGTHTYTCIIERKGSVSNVLHVK